MGSGTGASDGSLCNKVTSLKFCHNVLGGRPHCFNTSFSQVLAADIDVLHLSEDIVVVNKPASIPVHPTGNFRVSVSFHSRRQEGGTNIDGGGGGGGGGGEVKPS